MKLIRLAVILCFCSSVVLAETTLEIVQQRADAGDATAQALMGMMAFYGYQVPGDSEAAQEWFQRAADQGNSFAAKYVNVAKKKTEFLRAVSSNNPPSRVGSSKLSTSLSKDVLEKRIADASSAEFKGTVTMEDLLLKRTEYIGKVVKLRSALWNISTTFDPPSVSVHDVGRNSTYERLALCSQKALEWAMKESKRGYSSASEVYVLVGEKDLIALGEHRSEGDGVFTYSW